MIQTIIWMLCVYLVVKGKELQFIAAGSAHESREANLQSARVWARLCYVAAAIFFLLSLAQSSGMPSTPRGF